MSSEAASTTALHHSRGSPPSGALADGLNTFSTAQRDDGRVDVLVIDHPLDLTAESVLVLVVRTHVGDHVGTLSPAPLQSSEHGSRATGSPVNPFAAALFSLGYLLRVAVQGEKEKKGAGGVPGGKGLRARHLRPTATIISLASTEAGCSALPIA